ncbi:tail protein X [Megamonas funiformis]|jgi:phage tail protein X|uniref:tail protein X n=1 Tax=Megamonas funiformis TaxID=437897 RepID=UPI00204543DF|nr:tail protein X [Megamonas funiformis]DAW27693.1 MAG TPA: baseplate wedge protein [Caudoviricetes sp.]
MRTYTTIQGDMWDGIAKKIYGTENGINVLLEANLKYRDIIIFSGGILLNIPEYTAPMINNLPPWRR